MRKLLTILFFFFSLTSYAQTTYYVDTSGSDANAGTSTVTAWKTIAKVNGSTFSAGSQILFKRGQTWHESLIPPSNGTAGNNIVFGAYGTGARPIITGLTTLSGWTNLGSNKWEKTVNSGAVLNVVTVSGVLTAMGRYPNYPTQFAYTGSTANTNIQDNSFPTSPSWNGATVVLRSETWALDYLVNITHSASGGGSQFTSATPYSLGNVAHIGNGYFLQNSLLALDAQNEWYYTPNTKITIYSTTDPASTVKVSTIDDIVSITSKGYITIRDLRLEGADRAAVFLTSSSNINVINCDIEFVATSGVTNWDSFSSTAVSNITVDSCNIKNCHSNGVYISGASGTNANTTVTNDTIKNIGMLPGMGTPDSDQLDGIFTRSNGTTIRHNFIDSVGGSCISMFDRNWTVDSNYCQHWNFLIDDIGGIYTSHVTNADPGTGTRRITNNIVVNGFPTPAGKAGMNPQCEGIYMDTPAEGIVVQGNTTGNLNHNGLFPHYTFGTTIRDNTVFNAGSAQLAMWTEGGSSGASYPISGMTIKNNILFSKIHTQRTAMYYYPDGNTSPGWGTLDSNIYVNPFKFAGTINVESFDGGSNSSSQNSYDVVSWKALSSQDAHSTTGLAPRLIPYNIISITGANKAATTSYTWSGSPGYVEVGTITSGTRYRVQLTSSAVSTHSNLRVLFMNSDPTTGGTLVYSDDNYSRLLTTPTSEEFILTANTTGLARLYLYCPSPVTHTVSNIDVREITSVTFPDPNDSIYFNYNGTRSAVVLTLPGSHYWKDAKGNRFPGTITLQPYTSTVLIIDTGSLISNIPPIANAGIDRTITWPTNSTSSSGTTDSDPDGTVVARLWTQISGPNTAIISSPATAATNFTGLTVGVYQMKYTVTDNMTAQTSDTMQITVNASSAPKIAAIYKENTYDLRGYENEGGGNPFGLVNGLYDPKNGTTSRGAALDTANLLTSIHASTKAYNYNSEQYGSQIDYDLKINYNIHEIWLYEWGFNADSAYVLAGDWNTSWDTLARYKSAGGSGGWGWKHFYVNSTAHKIRVFFKNTPYDSTDGLAELTEMVLYGNPIGTPPSQPSTVYSGSRQPTPTVKDFIWINTFKEIDSTKWWKPFGGVRIYKHRNYYDTARLNTSPVKNYRENYFSSPPQTQLQNYTQTLKNMNVKMYVSYKETPQYIQSSGGVARDWVTDTYGGPGLKYKYYEGDWSTLPNFSLLTPKDSGYVPNIDIHPAVYASRPDSFAYMWEGYINIPTAGTWTFETRSDDGSKFYWNQFYSSGGTALVNNDGIHPPFTASGSVIVNAPGKYPIAITYFEADRGDSMQVFWTGPGVARQLIPNSAFSQQIQDARNKENYKTDSMFFWHRAALFGSTVHPLSEIHITDVPKFSGINTMNEIQIGNEENQWVAPTGYEDPVIAAARTIKVYGGIKNADINSKVIMSPYTKLDTNALKVQYYALKMMGDTTKQYYDAGVTYHSYIWKGQPEFPATNIYATGPTQLHGELPEKWNMLPRLRKVREATYRIAGNTPMFVDEFNWSRNASNPFNVPLIRTLDAASSQGCLLVKSLNYGLFAGLDRMAIYWMVNDVGDGSAEIFDAMGLMDAPPPFYQEIPFKSYYWVATYANILGNYKPLSMDTSGAIWVFKYQHKTLTDSVAYFIAAKDTGTTVFPYGLAVGSTLGNAKRVKFSDTRDTGLQSSLTPASNTVTIDTVGYIPQMILVLEGVPSNIPPIANAGPDQVIALPVTSVAVSGSLSTDPDGTIITYNWSKVSGPSSYTINSPSSMNTILSNLTTGVYVFRLTVTDNLGATNTDDVVVTVLVGSTFKIQGYRGIFK